MTKYIVVYRYSLLFIHIVTAAQLTQNMQG